MTVATITTSGEGRRWAADEPKGFWRTFAEINHEDDAAVQNFVRRYGDPEGELAPACPVHTGLWYPLMTVLALFRNAWSEPDREGISRALPDPNAFGGWSVEQAKMLVNQTDVRVTFEPKPVARCAHLGDYMIASAAFMLENKTPMRRCDQCGHWYGLQRRTGRFCSGECRSAAARLRKDQGHVIGA